MPIKLSGLVSNMDTDAIIKELMSAQSLKKRKIEDKKTKLNWKQEKWKDLNSKLYSFHLGILSQTRKQGSYNSKKATSSDESKVTATVTGSAPKGAHTMEVNQLASSQFITGGVIKRPDGGTVTSTTRLMDLGIDKNTIITIEAAKKKDQKAEDTSNIQKVTVDEKTTISDFLSACTKAGLTANFDASQKRLFISSKESGVDQKFSITTTSVNQDFVAAKDALDQSLGYSRLTDTDKAAADAAYQELRDHVAGSPEYDAAMDTLKNLKSQYDYRDKTTQAVDKAAKDYQDGFFKAKAESILKDYSDQTAWESSSEGLAWKTANPSATPAEIKTAYENGRKKALELAGHSDTDTQYLEKFASKSNWLASSDGQDWLAGQTGTPTEPEKEAAYQAALAAETTACSENIQKGDSAEHTALFEEIAKKVSAKYGVDNITQADIDAAKTAAGLELTETDYRITHTAGIMSELTPLVTKYVTLNAEADASQDANGNSMLTKLGLAEITGLKEFTSTTPDNVSGLTVTTAKNSKFVLDGASMEETSNNFKINFMNFNLISKTDAGSPVKIVVENDTEATYKMVKDFVGEFNTLLKEMNDLYYADAAKGYEPLNSEEKSAMSEDEVKQWEDKIKDSLLRRDSTLNGVAVTMKTEMMQQLTIDGKKVSLASFGIHTSTDYTEKGLLHIFGDADDTNKEYASKENILKKSIEEDPDLVMNTLSALCDNLYDKMNDKMAGNSLSSVLTFYNDKQMDKQSREYATEIKNWEKKLEDMETRYYKQFTAMEVAMSKLQSQGNSLASLMGTSS